MIETLTPIIRDHWIALTGILLLVLMTRWVMEARDEGLTGRDQMTYIGAKIDNSLGGIFGILTGLILGFSALIIALGDYVVELLVVGSEVVVWVPDIFAHLATAVVGFVALTGITEISPQAFLVIAVMSAIIGSVIRRRTGN